MKIPRETKINNASRTDKGRQEITLNEDSTIYGQEAQVYLFVNVAASVQIPLDRCFIFTIYSRLWEGSR